MSLIVETGVGIINADSYVATADCAAYALSRGLTFGSDALADAALRRATAYVDNQYRLRFPGYRTFRRAQALEWPRTNAYYTYTTPPGPVPVYSVAYAYFPYDLVPATSIPPEIITATCEAAIREYAEPGVLQPDLDRGGAVSLLKAGSVEVKYAAGAPAQTVFQIIDAALSGLIGVQSAYSARAVRG